MDLDSNPPVILLTSHVAGSRVGGSVTSEILLRRGHTPELVPTVVFGRHPGRGAPGGGAVPDALFSGALDGLKAERHDRAAQAILTGYFASPGQVGASARFIEEARAHNPHLFVLVDPICGDGTPDGTAGGLYVEAATARALRDRLLPLADLITPNAFELAWLTGTPIASPEDAAQAARTLGRDTLVTSVPGSPGALGVLAVEAGSSGAAWLAETGRLDRVPYGTGDLFAVQALCARLDGAPLKTLARIATQRTRAAIQATVKAGAGDLVLAASEADAQSLEPVRMTRLGARSPAWVMGLDGCPAGWVGVMIDLNRLEAPRLAIYAGITDALNAPEHAHVIAVDMPIGFETAPSGPGGRACEREARARLGQRRSSIFAAPLRTALRARNHEEASRLNRATGGPGLSRQSFNLFAKMREIDAVMSPALEGCLHESHPELIFATLAGRPMAHAKRTPAGRAERLDVLVGQGLDPALFEPHPFKHKVAAPDDVLDAAACALAAVRLAEGNALCLPADPPRDDTGLRMAIFA